MQIAGLECIPAPCTSGCYARSREEGWLNVVSYHWLPACVTVMVTRPSGCMCAFQSGPHWLPSCVPVQDRPSDHQSTIAACHMVVDVSPQSTLSFTGTPEIATGMASGLLIRSQTKDCASSLRADDSQNHRFFFRASGLRNE